MCENASERETEEEKNRKRRKEREKKVLGNQCPHFVILSASNKQMDKFSFAITLNQYSFLLSVIDKPKAVQLTPVLLNFLMSVGRS